jgi:hypothetical protein
MERNMRSIERAEVKVKRLLAQADAYMAEEARLRALADGQRERAMECRRQAATLRTALNKEQDNEARRIVHVE